MKHFVGSYRITGVPIMLLAAVAEKEIYIPGSAVIAESGTEANTHFFDHTVPLKRLYSRNRQYALKLDVEPDC